MTNLPRRFDFRYHTAKNVNAYDQFNFIFPTAKITRLKTASFDQMLIRDFFPTVTRPYATPHDHSRFQADNSDFFSFIGFTPYTSSTRFLQGRFHYCFPGRGSNPINWPNFTQIRPDLMKNRSILEILGGPGRDNRGLAWLNRHEWL